jgi:membrane-bound lytic murein transglycosylase A
MPRLARRPRPVLATACALVLAVGLAGCAGSRSAPSPPGGGAEAPAPPEAAPPDEAAAEADGAPDAPAFALAPLAEAAPAGVAALPGWGADDPRAALRAFARSCDAWRTRPPDAPLGREAAFGCVGDWLPACAAVDTLLARAPWPDDARRLLDSLFVPRRVLAHGAATGLFTGYFEPLLHGARDSSARYATPLYRRPPDLVTVDLGRFAPDLDGRTVAGRVVEDADEGDAGGGGPRLVPYFDRAAIAGGALRGRGLELVWVDDPVDAFFLEIQGSGRVELPSGEVLRVGYAAANGRPYRAIGRDLIALGALTRATVSLQTIRAWLAAHPARADSVLHLNPSYVFFQRLRDLPLHLGPMGAQRVPLTPGRSLAVDRRYLPLGVPLWLDASAPTPDGDGTRTLRRLVVAQDTGGAIRGAVRGDVFWGAGPEARAVAGRMQHPGRLVVLLPRTLATP